jgi:hypothetical protein
MITNFNSPKTAAAIGAAIEMACATGDLEAAERLFESYRRLFADRQAHKSAPPSLPIPDPDLRNTRLEALES